MPLQAVVIIFAQRSAISVAVEEEQRQKNGFVSKICKVISNICLYIIKKSLIIHIYMFYNVIHTYMSTVLPSRTFLGRDSGLSLVWHHASWKTHDWNDPWPIHIRVMSHFSRWIPHLDHPGCLISFDGRLPAQTNSLQRGQMWQECHVSSIRGKPWIWKIPRNSEPPMFTADSVLRCLEHR